MIITILNENKTFKSDLLAEHGLSIHIKGRKEELLFDTGLSSNYLINAKNLGIDITQVKYVFISHGHYDHAGGIQYFPIENNIEKIYLHKDAFMPKYALKENNKYSYNGIPWNQLDSTMENKIIQTENLFQISENLYVLGNIKHKHKNKKYYLQKGNQMVVDDFHDEQVLIIKFKHDLAVFMGCSHFGVIEGLEAVKKHFPEDKIKSLIGGMHLGSKSRHEIMDVIDKLKTYNIEHIIPLHCTGVYAMGMMKETFGDKCHLLSTGDSIEI